MAPIIEIDSQHVGVAAEEIWKARVFKEKLIAANWPGKWNWMLEEYNGMNKQLGDLKKLRPIPGRLKSMDTRSCKPLPSTSSKVIGWLANQPDFKLEMFGPYIKKIPLLPQSVE